MICPSGQGRSQKLGTRIIIGDHFLHQQNEITDVVSFSNCLQTMQTRFDLGRVEIVMANVASNLSVRCRDQILISQILFFKHLLAWTNADILNLDVSIRLKA